jgi:hypothetical protein
MSTPCPACGSGAPHVVTASRAGGVAIFLHARNGDEMSVEGSPEAGAATAAGLLSSCVQAWTKIGAEVPEDVRVALELLRARVGESFTDLECAVAPKGQVH